MLLESRERAFDLEAVEQVTAGVDVQDDRLVYVVAGFSAASEQLWILAHGETIGDPRDGEVWRGLAGNLQVPFGRLPVSIVSVDAGFLTSTVKKECQRRRWWIPTVGRAGAGIPIAKRISQTTGIATAGKDDLSAWWSGRVATGKVHLPADISRRHVAELCAAEALTAEGGALRWRPIEGRQNRRSP